MVISKVQRRNKTQVKQLEPTYEFTTREKIINLLRESKDGMTFGEIYAKMPKMSPRNIREHIQKLKNNNQLTMETCRCNSATIYYLR